MWLYFVLKANTKLGDDEKEAMAQEDTKLCSARTWDDARSCSAWGI